MLWCTNIFFVQKITKRKTKRLPKRLPYQFQQISLSIGHIELKREYFVTPISRSPVYTGYYWRNR
ncbi:hypothetical protein FXE51_11195 [Vibrio mimicus]|uniref:Uncharacterized protein n=1 Tax=Vibrio mimicus TaxID=674 RepID=A0A2J9VLI0_VIBMI|nr:hypothetical protein AL544_006835 [Vibrio mimicus]TXZ75488.1 hypothetical protein FXE51_11195 [Vibrio mimicus]